MTQEARFDALYSDHARAVLAYARRRCDPATADDVLADVFLVAWRRLDDIPSEPRGWLLGVARRTLANHRRSATRRAALHDELRSQRPVSDTPDHGDVHTALETLRPKDREALLLTSWDGLTPSEAAAALGVRPGTFTMRLTRARRRFAAALTAAGTASEPNRSSRSTEASR